MSDTSIHIALATDLNYLDFAVITVYSVIHWHKSGEKLHFHIFTRDVANQAFEKFLPFQSSNVEIENHPVDTEAFARRWGGNTSPTYYRLELAERLPDVEKCIYLDCDVIALDNIVQLWEQDLQGRPLGGVGDRAGLQPARRIYNKKQPMFNAGVLLLDLAQWRREGYVEKLSVFLNKNQSWCKFADQGLLNAFFDGNYTMLPQRWNIINSVYRNPPVENMYDADEVKESIRHPGIVHFTGHHKPWLFWKSFHHPYGYTFCLCAMKCPVGFWFKTKLRLKLLLRRGLVDSPKKRSWGKQDIQNISFD